MENLFFLNIHYANYQNLWDREKKNKTEAFVVMASGG